MPIVTPRLILRSLRESDGPAIAKATEETWDGLSRWMRWATDRKQLTNIDNCKDYAARCERDFLEKKDFTFGGFLKDGDGFVLISRLASLGKEQGSYEFGGYWCSAAYQRKGFMSEAINAIIRYAVSEMDAKHFQITHAAGNDKTRAVMDRLGFIENQILRKAHRLPGGSIVDEHVLVRSGEEGLPSLEVTWDK